MTQNEIIRALDQLGKIFEKCQLEDEFIIKAHINNNWYTPDMQMAALKNWAKQLTESNLSLWASSYHFTSNPKKIGVIMAGNIPLVGLHDLVCVLVSGHHALIKSSANDSILTPWVINQLITIDNRIGNLIVETEKLNTCEVLIATGSNNSARYFEFYFRDKPKIVRKNRNSIAVLSGNETFEHLQELGKDIFLYFGLGCRNISKLLVPENYNFETFFQAIEINNERIHHNKYYNNYTYHKAIFLMNITPHLDNGFLILKEDNNIASPLGCLFYQYYTNQDEVISYLNSNRDAIQIVVGDKTFGDDCIPFGESQNTGLYDYADQVDTMKFLNEL